MRLIRGLIGIDLEEPKLRGVVPFGNGIDRENARFDADRGFHLLLDDNLVAFQLGRIDLELGDAHDRGATLLGDRALAQQ
jgi:hypothetical protein